MARFETVRATAVRRKGVTLQGDTNFHDRNHSFELDLNMDTIVLVSGLTAFCLDGYEVRLLSKAFTEDDTDDNTE